MSIDSDRHRPVNCFFLVGVTDFYKKTLIETIVTHVYHWIGFKGTF